MMAKVRRLTQKQREQVEAERDALLFLDAALYRIYEIIGRLPASFRKQEMGKINTDIGKAFQIIDTARNEVKPIVKKAAKRKVIAETDKS